MSMVFGRHTAGRGDPVGVNTHRGRRGNVVWPLIADHHHFFGAAVEPGQHFGEVFRLGFSEVHEFECGDEGVGEFVGADPGPVEPLENGGARKKGVGGDGDFQAGVERPLHRFARSRDLGRFAAEGGEALCVKRVDVRPGLFERDVDAAIEDFVEDIFERAARIVIPEHGLRTGHQTADKGLRRNDPGQVGRKAL